MNENTKRFGPTACSWLTITGITLAFPADAEPATDDAGTPPVGVVEPHAATTMASRASRRAAIDRGTRRA